MAEQSFILPKGMNWTARIAQIAKLLSGLAVGKTWEVVISERRSTRSDQQNKYLWSCAYKLLSEHTGYEAEEIHDVLLGKYFGEREKRVPRSANFPTGIKRVPNRTTTTNETGKRDVLAWDAFCEYVAFVQRTAAKVGCFIPDPDPNWRQHQEREAA